MQGAADEVTATVNRVLIIEDDQPLAATLGYNPQKQDCHVTLAARGLDGIKTARGIRPDIIILDLLLPNIDGRVVCRHTYHGEREFRLAPKDFQIVIALMRRGGKVCTRAVLTQKATVEEVFVDPRNVDVQVRLIRAQLEGGPDGSWLIQTVPGVGYRFAGELGPNLPVTIDDSEGRAI